MVVLSSYLNLLILFWVNRVHSGNDGAPSRVGPLITNADLTSKSFKFRPPENEYSDLTRMMSLPQSIHALILGNFERLHPRGKSDLENFYITCTASEPKKKLIRGFEEIIVEGIFAWKSSKGLDSKLLDESVRNCIVGCMQQPILDTSSTQIMRNAKPYISNRIGHPSVSCVGESSKVELLAKLNNKIQIIGIKISFGDIREVIRGLPIKACARVIVTSAAFNIVRESGLAIYGRLVQSVQRQVINVIRRYLENPEIDQSKIQLALSTRKIFFNYIEWYEKMYEKDEIGELILDEKYYYQSNIEHLARLDDVLQFVPIENHPVFKKNWKTLTMNLNLPVDISPIILGNMHYVTVTAVQGLLDLINSYRDKSFGYSQFKEMQRKLMTIILRWKYILNNLEADGPPSILEEVTTKCEEDCSEPSEDDVIIIPNYKKIGDTIQCTNISRDVKEKWKFIDIMKNGNSISSEDLTQAISLLPAENCAWASLLRHLYIQKYSSDKVDGMNIHIGLMNLLNDITSALETNQREELIKQRKQLLRDKNKNNASTSSVKHEESSSGLKGTQETDNPSNPSTAGGNTPFMGICIFGQMNPSEFLPYLEKIPTTSGAGISINPIQVNIGGGSEPQAERGKAVQSKDKEISSSNMFERSTSKRINEDAYSEIERPLKSSRSETEVGSQATKNQRVFTPLDSSHLSFSHSFPAASGSATYGAENYGANERENIGETFVSPEVGKPKGLSTSASTLSTLSQINISELLPFEDRFPTTSTTVIDESGYPKLVNEERISGNDEPPGGEKLDLATNVMSFNNILLCTTTCILTLF